MKRPERPTAMTSSKFGVIALSIALTGCSSSEATTTDAGSTRDAYIEVPAESCAQPGDMGNEIGVGAFCSPAGNQCSAFTQARLCLADVVRDEGQWFCTRTCTTSEQCGSGAVCVIETRGGGCVPAQCAPEDEDAGATDDADVSADASSDSDAGT